MALDHDKRRRDIAWITIDLIAREGLEAATIRRIAAEAGFSTTAITHYFVDKQELLVWTFQNLSAEGEQQFKDALRYDSTDLIGALLTMVPWCPTNIRRWKAYLAFWDEAARNPELAVLLAESTNAGTKFLQQLIKPKVAAQASLEKAGQLLNAIIQGRALQMLVDRQNWNENRIRAALEEALNLVVSTARLDS
jgi:AcrR family transcriptional regulator